MFETVRDDILLVDFVHGTREVTVLKFTSTRVERAYQY